jgi:hypothetical protein
MFSARFPRGQRLRGRVLAVAYDVVFFLASRDPGNADSIADHAGGALPAFRSAGV